ncbi:molybdopterin synthase sulfur carrier subunit [Thermocladium modestius]|uniref:Molybdopterin synthase sulfur carrier subunit n=2 Tax=Thermocladium modestius TaxID=62609 RepID=A0A830GVV5_9CREN|nr:molybdopterin synthase sulfur carrier subunit [Thermocladium modestius]
MISPMKVIVKFLATFYDIAKTLRTEIEVPDDATISDLLKTIDEKINPSISKTLLDGDKVRDGYNILVNGRAIEFKKGLQTELSDGDEVVLLPPIGGG